MRDITVVCRDLISRRLWISMERIRFSSGAEVMISPPPTVDKSSPHHPASDPRYADHDFPEDFTESLSTTLDRVLPYYEENIVPQLKEGKTVIVAAHGNSLRALVKHLDNIDEATIAELNIPTGTPLIYELDDDLNVIPSAEGMSPLRGKYLGDQDAIRARIEGVKNQTK